MTPLHPADDKLPLESLSSARNPLEALRRFARKAPPPAQERCDLCGEAIAEEHRHLLSLSTRQVLCACRACALLFDSPVAGAGERRLIPTRVHRLDNFKMTEAQWMALEIPVRMAFFCKSAASGKVTAFYPSPVGPTESALPQAAWEALAETNPVLQEMQPEVEALLVRRDREASDIYLLPIDDCFRLVGRIRTHWRGIGGGQEVRDQIDAFFAEMNARA